MLVLVVDALLDRRRTSPALPIITIAGLLVALASVFYDVPAGQYFRGFVTVDAFTTFFRAVFIVLAIFAAAVSPAYLARRAIPPGEYYAIICFSTVGAMTIALSADLITLFIGLETMTIPIYVLAGIQRSDRFANEAALKYFLLGAFSSALLLYGFAWLYGVAHATDFVTIASVLTSQGIANGATIVALALITVGLGFKAGIERRCGRPLLRLRVRPHDPPCVRVPPLFRPRGHARRHHRRVQRLPDKAAPWRSRLRDLPHRAHRDPADHRLRREGLRDLAGARRGTGLARGGHRAERRPRGLLLLARGRPHVHVRARREGPAARDSPRALAEPRHRLVRRGHPRDPAEFDLRVGARGGPASGAVKRHARD